MTTVSVQVPIHLVRGATPDPHLELTSQRGVPRAFSLDAPVTTLGRGASNEVPLVGDRISRRHAVVVRDGENYVLHDLGSLNGVWINTEPLTAGAKRPLRDGDLIRLGDQQVVFRDPRARAKPPRRRAAISPSRPVRARRARARGRHPVAAGRGEVRHRRVIVTLCVLLAALLAAAISLVVNA